MTVIGRTILVDGSPFTVIGVLPPGFQFFQPDLDMWMPLPVDAAFHDRDSHSIMVFGRLAPGASLARAQAEMDAAARTLGEMHPDAKSRLECHRCASLSDARSEGASACTARPDGRRRSRAVDRLRERRKPPAGPCNRSAQRDRHTCSDRCEPRGRLIRQILIESIVIATIGGVSAVAVARWGIALLVPLLPHAGTNTTVSAFRSISPTLDVRMLSFSIAIGVITGIIFGMIPALQTTRPDVLRVWTSSHLTPRAGRVLLVVGAEPRDCAAERGRAVDRELICASAARVDPGFQSDHLLTMQVWLPRTKYPAASGVRGFFDQVISRIDALPGVRGASAISHRPFLSMGTGTSVEIDGRAPSSPGEQPTTEYRVVTPTGSFA